MEQSVKLLFLRGGRCEPLFKKIGLANGVHPVWDSGLFFNTKKTDRNSAI